MPTVLISFSTTVPRVILNEASLSFLGYGIPPPAPSWGGMLSGSGRQYMFKAPWMVIFPGLALSIVVFGINMFGDAVRDLLDPRMRGGIGRFGLLPLTSFGKAEEQDPQEPSAPDGGSTGNKGHQLRESTDS